MPVVVVVVVVVVAPAKARVLLGAATELLLRGHGTTGCPVDDDDDDDDDADDDDDVQAASVFGFAHIIYCIRQLLQNSVPQPQTDSATRFRRVSYEGVLPVLISVLVNFQRAFAAAPSVLLGRRGTSIYLRIPPPAPSHRCVCAISVYLSAPPPGAVAPSASDYHATVARAVRRSRAGAARGRFRLAGGALGWLVGRLDDWLVLGGCLV